MDVTVTPIIYVGQVFAGGAPKPWQTLGKPDLCALKRGVSVHRRVK